MRGGLLVALGLSVAALLVERAGWVAWVGGARVGLVLLPWIVVAGLPRARGAVLHAELAPLLALPVVALAAAVDRAQVGAWPLGSAGAGLVVVALLALGAARGGGGYAAAWLALAVLPAGLATAFALSAAGAPEGAGPAGVGRWLAATPWVAVGRQVAAGAGESALGPGALGCAALLAAVGLAEGARRGAEPVGGRA